jgi:hypothetical protein
MALAGMLIVSAPFLAYFAINNEMAQFVQAVIGTPVTENAGGMLDRVLSLQSPLHWVAFTNYVDFENKLLWPVFCLYLIYTCWRWGHNGKSDKNIPLIVYFSMFYMAILAYWPNSFTHVVPLIPIMEVGAASLIVTLFEREITWLRALRIHPSHIFHIRSNLIPFISGILLLSIISISIVNIPSSIQNVQRFSPEATPPQSLVAYIDRWTTPNQRIIMLSSPLTYYFSERQPAIPYFFHGYETMDPKIVEEIQTCIYTKCAALIVVNYEFIRTNIPGELALFGMVSHSPAYHMATVLDQRYAMYEISKVEAYTSTVVFYMQDSHGNFHPEGSVNLSGLGSYPTDGQTHVSIPNGHYTLTAAHIPSGFTLSKSGFGPWGSNPNDPRLLEFSSRTMNSATITLNFFNGAVYLYIQ